MERGDLRASDRGVPVDPGRRSHHACSGKGRPRKSWIHREYLVGCGKGRFHRPDKLCRGKERLARHDDVDCQGMVEVRRSTNSVCFGGGETPMTETIRGDKFRDGLLARIPMGRLARTEKAVKPVCVLLSGAG